MKKYKYLGVNGNYCCILTTFVSFDIISEEINNIAASDFKHDSTDWCGQDKIERTIRLKNFCIGRKIKLNRPITFHGTDYDMGHSYSWHFTIKEIWEVVDN